MASTYSTNLALELIGTGDQAGTWGNTTNTNLGTLIEQAISGYVTQAITDGADTVITIPNGATGVARNMFIEMTGALTAARNLIVPANKKLYFIYNNTTGGFAVTVKVSGQTGVSVSNGRKVLLVSNGTDVVEAHNTVVGTFNVGGAVTFASTLAVTGHTTFEGVTSTGATGTGNLVYSASPTFTGTANFAAVSTSGDITNNGSTIITGYNISAGASKGIIGFYSAGDNFSFWSYGKDASTTGQFSWNSRSSNGSLGTTVMSLDRSGNLTVPAVYSFTTAAAANLYIDSAGNFYRSTSSLQYKKNLVDLTLDEAKSAVFGNHAFSYQSASPNDDQDARWIGYAAEEVVVKDRRFTSFDRDGNPNGVQYERYIVPHAMIIEEHEARIAALEAELNAIKQKIGG